MGSNRRNLLVPVPHYHDVIEYNRELLDKHKIKAAEIHYKKQVPIHELFEEDKKALYPLPSKPFEAATLVQYKADGYGRVCMDGKHFYSTKPQNKNSKVWLGLKAHHVVVYDSDWSILVVHRRQYGSDRTDTADYSTTVAVLSQNPGAWKNSGVRKDADLILNEYMDGLGRQDLKSKLKLLNELTKQYGYWVALEAMSQSVRNNSISDSDAKVMAERISGFGLGIPSVSSTPLSVYDDAFLKGTAPKGGGQE